MSATTQRLFSAEAEADVRAAYEWILGRQADANGLDHYASAIDRGDIDNGKLRAAFFASDEFKAAHGGIRRVVEIGNGLKAVVDPYDIEFGRFIAEHGGWEWHVVDAIRANLKPGDAFVDVGGNIGLMSFNAAQQVCEDGKVIAFEPNPVNVANFRRGILANGFSNVLLYPFAVSDQHRMLTTTAASNAKVTDEADPLSFNDVGQAVPADFFLDREDRIDLIKIDIEGYELPALKGLDQTLRRHQPKVLLEFNPLCLTHQGGIDPSEMAHFIFTMTGSVEIVEHDKGRTAIHSPTELMQTWAERDERASSAGLLPKGWAHFDLLFRACG